MGECCMRTCSKCGRANTPTRKFCVRCGASLLIPLEENDATPEPERRTTVAETTPDSPRSADIPSAETAVASPSDKTVRPSEVDRDRLRTAPGSKEKSEMEKAREAFARAEEVGIEEEVGEGIIETRMLRASEVRELLDEATIHSEESTTPSVETPPSSVSTDPEAIETPAETSTVTPPPKSKEEELLGRFSPYADQQPDPDPSVVSDAIPESSIEEPAESSLTSPEPQPRTVEELPSTPPTPEPSAEVITEPPASGVTATPHDQTSTAGSIAEVEALLSEISDPEFLQDDEVQQRIERLVTLHTELKQVDADLNEISSQLDEEVQKYRNAAEVKRINYENLQEQFRLAKQEYSDSKDEYQRSESRRKKELSAREKRISDIKRRISNGERIVRKRVKELAKRKEKLAKSSE